MGKLRVFTKNKGFSKKFLEIQMAFSRKKVVFEKIESYFLLSFENSQFGSGAVLNLICTKEKFFGSFLCAYFFPVNVSENFQYLSLSLLIFIL